MSTSLLALIKLCDVLARAIFVLIVGYTLPLKEAGQFGLYMSVTTVFAFIVGWERYLDLQRNVVGECEVYFDKSLFDSISFYVFNHILVLPVYLLLIWLWTDFNYMMLASSSLILIGEQLGNQVYQIALINSRYRHMVWFLFARSTILLSIVLVLLIWEHGRSNLLFIFCVWATLSGLFSIGVTKQWASITTHRQHVSETHVSLSRRIISQHKSSFFHFIIGLVAIMSLQIDRLVVGSVLNLNQTGVYFRNILVSSIFLQFFSIVSNNRVLPKILVLAKERLLRDQVKLISKELVFMLMFFVLAVAGLGTVYFLTDGIVFLRYNILWEVILILLVAALFRVIGDYASLILHSYKYESLVLRSQIITLALSTPIVFIFTYQFQIFGAATSMLFSSIVYMVITIRFVVIRLAGFCYE